MGDCAGRGRARGRSGARDSRDPEARRASSSMRRAPCSMPSAPCSMPSAPCAIERRAMRGASPGHALGLGYRAGDLGMIDLRDLTRARTACARAWAAWTRACAIARRTSRFGRAPVLAAHPLDFGPLLAQRFLDARARSRRGRPRSIAGATICGDLRQHLGQRLVHRSAPTSGISMVRRQRRRRRRRCAGRMRARTARRALPEPPGRPARRALPGRCAAWTSCIAATGRGDGDAQDRGDLGPGRARGTLAQPPVEDRPDPAGRARCPPARSNWPGQPAVDLRPG